MKIGLNAGHDINLDLGAINQTVGIDEAHVVREIALMAKTMLEGFGHEVVFIQDNNLCGEEGDFQDSVCGKLNSTQTDVNVSLHCNAWGGADNGACGTEVYYWPTSAKGELLAKMLLANIVRVGFAERGIKDGKWLGFIKKTNATSVLVEIGFIRHPHDAGLLQYEKTSIAYAIAEAINNFFKEAQ